MSPFRKFDPQAFRETAGTAKPANPAKTSEQPGKLSRFSQFSRTADRSNAPDAGSRAEPKAKAAEGCTDDRNPGPCEVWSAEDWHAFFDERAAVREHDGGLDRIEAEHQALEDTVDHWLSCHPAPATSEHSGCAHCGARERPGDALLPVLTRDGHTWVHDKCWPAWLQCRRAEARRALTRMGLKAIEPRAKCSTAPTFASDLPRDFGKNGSA